MAGILVISPHADDETLGCGGLLSLPKDCRVHWLVCADEEKPFPTVSEYYNFDSDTFLSYPDGKFNTLPFDKIVSELSRFIQYHKPDTVLMPFHKDIHSDHRIIAKATLAACKPFRAPFVKTLLMYETLSQTTLSMEDFHPNYFVNITTTIKKKKEAANLYGKELMTLCRSDREIEALAIYRGSFVNVPYAEAYQVVRMITC